MRFKSFGMLVLLCSAVLLTQSCAYDMWVTKQRGQIRQENKERGDTVVVTRTTMFIANNDSGPQGQQVTGSACKEIEEASLARMQKSHLDIYDSADDNPMEVSSEGLEIDATEPFVGLVNYEVFHDARFVVARGTGWDFCPYYCGKRPVTAVEARQRCIWKSMDTMTDKFGRLLDEPSLDLIPGGLSWWVRNTSGDHAVGVRWSDGRWQTTCVTNLPIDGRPLDNKVRGRYDADFVLNIQSLNNIAGECSQRTISFGH